MKTRMFAMVLLCGVTLLAGSACSNDDNTATNSRSTAPSSSTVPDPSGPSSPTTTSSSAGHVADETLRIMVTNDDGVAAAGIAAVVDALRAQPNTEVSVIAPASQQSGSGPKTTPGPLEANESKTANGVTAMAVDGFPADTVIWALDQGGLAQRPHLVVSGVNEGQNLGPVLNVSGTIGAARAAAARGIPALAASQGMGSPPSYEVAVRYVTDWVAAHRDALLRGTEPVAVTNINAPTCGTGTVRGLVDVPFATDPAGRNVLAANIDCATDQPAGADDVGAFNVGFVTESVVPTAA